MAVTRNIAKPMTREEDRVGSITIDTPPSGGYSIHMRRVITGRANDGSVVSAPRGGAQVDRDSTRVTSETATLASGTIVKLADIIEALDVLADRWVAEDDVARAAAVLAPGPGNAPGRPA